MKPFSLCKPCPAKSAKFWAHRSTKFILLTTASPVFLAQRLLLRLNLYPRSRHEYNQETLEENLMAFELPPLPYDYAALERRKKAYS